MTNWTPNNNLVPSCQHNQIKVCNNVSEGGDKVPLNVSLTVQVKGTAVPHLAFLGFLKRCNSGRTKSDDVFS